MSDTQHTFLLEPGRWVASGLHIDALGTPRPLSGATDVRHEADGWRISGFLPLDERAGSVGGNCCRVVPLAGDGAETCWRAETILGRLSGILLLVKDSILSTGQSEDGTWVVSEWLQRIDADRYVNRGVLLRRGERQFSWAVELERSA
ncbi:MAG: hypothetical protein AB7D57_13555 [Desulfovibrionaceae bacterium]